MPEIVPASAPARSRWRRGAACMALGLMVPLLSGCGRSVRVEAPADVPPARAALCAAAAARLPTQTIAGRSWAIDPPTSLAAAWGSPPVVWRCGVPGPTVPAGTQLIEVSGVAWYAEPLTEGTRYTTVGRAATAEVQIPQEWDPAGDVLVDLAPAAQALPVQARG